MPEHSPSPTPVRAIYGFVLYLGTYFGFGVFILWAFLPERWLAEFGIIYLPQRYWVLAGPIYLCVTLLFTVIVYVAYNFMCTPSLDSIYTITDGHARYSTAITSKTTSGVVPPLADIHISVVNRELYQ